MRVIPLLLSVCGPMMLVAQTYTVMTYNIRYANGHDSKNRWELRSEALANTVLEHKPQIIGLQEVLHEQLTYVKDRWPG